MYYFLIYTGQKLINIFARPCYVFSASKDIFLQFKFILNCFAAYVGQTYSKTQYFRVGIFQMQKKEKYLGSKPKILKSQVILIKGRELTQSYFIRKMMAHITQFLSAKSISRVNFSVFIQNCKMPRKESLSDVLPNRYYDLQATVKYLHHTEKGTTAVIEENEVQKKIMLPPRSIELEEGSQYRFSKCFCTRNGWIKVKDTNYVQKIEANVPKEPIPLTLEEINEKRHEMFNNYITTTLQVISVAAPEKKEKNGNELTLTLVKGFAQNALVDITIWNKEFPEQYIGKKVTFDGFRVKMLTNNTFVLVSTVFSNFNMIHGEMEPEEYNPKKLYPSYSQVYSERTISQMRSTLNQLTKCFSIVSVKINEATVFDYEGCKICHKKLEGAICSQCGVETEKDTFWVCQLEVEDSSDSCTLYVFNQKEQDILTHAKKGSIIKSKIRSTIRLDPTAENNLESHSLVGIVSIQL